MELSQVQSLKPKVWYRHVDDTFAIWKHMALRNSRTMEIEAHHKSLDVFKLHRKPTQGHNYSEVRKSISLLMKKVVECTYDIPHRATVRTKELPYSALFSRH